MMLCPVLHFCCFGRGCGGCGGGAVGAAAAVAVAAASVAEPELFWHVIKSTALRLQKSVRNFVTPSTKFPTLSKSADCGSLPTLHKKC